MFGASGMGWRRQRRLLCPTGSPLYLQDQVMALTDPSASHNNLINVAEAKPQVNGFAGTGLGCKIMYTCKSILGVPPSPCKSMTFWRWGAPKGRSSQPMVARDDGNHDDNGDLYVRNILMLKNTRTLK